MNRVLGIDFGGTKTALAICDVSGRCTASRVIPTCPEHGASSVLSRAILASKELLQQAGDHDLIAVGVATLGIPLRNGVQLAPAIPGWERVALAPLIEAAFDVPVVTATDVKVAGLVEARRGALVGADPAIYLNLGTGLAVAILLNGQVLQGAHGAAGEIGYNLVERDHVGLGLNARPMLEDLVSGMGLAANASKQLGRSVTAKQVFEAAKVEQELDRIVDDMLAELSLQLVNLVIAIDPACVAVGGGLARSWERIRAPLEQALKSGVPFPPELVLAAYPFNGPLVGALTLAAEVGGVLPVDVLSLPVTLE